MSEASAVATHTPHHHVGPSHGRNRAREVQNILLWKNVNLGSKSKVKLREIERFYEIMTVRNQNMDGSIQVYVGFCVLCVPCKSLERNLVNESLRDIERY